MSYIKVPDGYDFNTQFPTWIIAFCPDLDCWFVTNQRFFYYEYEKEFESEEDGISFFKNHPEVFLKKEIEMNAYKPHFYEGGVWLDNTEELIRVEI